MPNHTGNVSNARVVFSIYICVLFISKLRSDTVQNDRVLHTIFSLGGNRKFDFRLAVMVTYYWGNITVILVIYSKSICDDGLRIPSVTRIIQLKGVVKGE